MKVKIGHYINWVGPYQIAEKILFWKDKYNDDIVHNFGRWLSGDTNPETLKNDNPSCLLRLCQWIHSKRKRKVKIHIDNYDTWSAYETIALIVHPILVELKHTQMGAPCTSDEDVPEHLRSTCAPPKENEWDTDQLHFDRWDWILGEMIWTFKQHTEDWETQFYSGKVDFRFIKGKDSNCSEMLTGPDCTFKIDEEGRKKHTERMENGMRLFAKYYWNLWN